MKESVAFIEEEFVRLDTNIEISDSKDRICVIQSWSN